MSDNVIIFTPKGKKLTSTEILQKVVKSRHFKWRTHMVGQDEHGTWPVPMPDTWLADHPANVGFLFEMLWAANDEGGCFNITPLDKGYAVTMFGDRDVDMSGVSLCVALAATLLFLTNPEGL